MVRILDSNFSISSTYKSSLASRFGQFYQFPMCQSVKTMSRKNGNASNIFFDILRRSLKFLAERTV